MYDLSYFIHINPLALAGMAQKWEESPMMLVTCDPHPISIGSKNKYVFETSNQNHHWLYEPIKSPTKNLNLNGMNMLNIVFETFETTMNQQLPVAPKPCRMPNQPFEVPSRCTRESHA